MSKEIFGYKARVEDGNYFNGLYSPVWTKYGRLFDTLSELETQLTLHFKRTRETVTGVKNLADKIVIVKQRVVVEEETIPGCSEMIKERMLFRVRFFKKFGKTDFTLFDELDGLFANWNFGEFKHVIIIREPFSGTIQHRSKINKSAKNAGIKRTKYKLGTTVIVFKNKADALTLKLAYDSDHPIDYICLDDF